MATSKDDPAPPFYVERDGSQSSVYQSISLHADYQHVSVEELRLQDYKAGRHGVGRGGAGCHSTTASNHATVKPLFSPAPLYQTNFLKPVRASANGIHRLGRDVILFLVGKDVPQEFTVHESIIKSRSEFVRLALRGEWKEANDRVIPLPDDEPHIFSVYQEWLYSGLLHTRGVQLVPKDEGEFALLVKAFILGEKIIDPDFKDCIIDAITEKLRQEQCFDTSLTNLVYENTPTLSPLRRLWMDVYYHFGNETWLENAQVGDEISSEFLADFSRYQMQKRTGFGSLGRDAMFYMCAYHTHGSLPCYRQRFKQNL